MQSTAGPTEALASPVRVELDDAQRDAVATALSAHATVVLGAPGTGKSTVAQEVVLGALESGLAPGEILGIAASRRAAAAAQDRLAAAAGRTVGAPFVRTAAGAAFAVLTRQSEALGEPLPTLIAGPEQDLILADILAGHLAGEGPDLLVPPGLPREVLGLRGMRQELRDLLMRAAENGLAPVDLARYGARAERPEWRFGAQLYQEYLDVTALGNLAGRGARFDPATVLDEAAEALANWDENALGAPPPRWRLVVVDDYQEATSGLARFLDVLQAAGSRLVVLADPDQAVLGFRGAAPALVGRASAPSGARSPGQFGAARCVLRTCWRQPDTLRRATARVTDHIGAIAGVAHRAARPVDGTGEVRVAFLPTGAQESAFVARELRAAHVLDGVPWRRMAVVTRTSAQLMALRRALVAADVPVEVLGSDVALRDEPAVAPLLTLLAAAADRSAQPDAETTSALLTSPVGGLDAVGLRRLRRALRAEELAGGGGRTSDALLVELVAEPARCAALPDTVRPAAEAVARALASGRAAADEPGADPYAVLWAIWDSTGLAERWRRTACAGGPAGVRADHDLDTVMTLFRAAEQFAERMPGAGAGAFAAHIVGQDLPADSLAAHGVGSGAVAGLTPPGAAGREWDVVVVAGVQDGIWPDLRLRDSLLGSQTLADLCAGRGDGQVRGRDARRAVLADELRSFAVAVSRARRRLIVTAVDGGDETPSPFCDLIVRPDPAEAAQGGRTEPAETSAGDETEGAADPRRVRVGMPLDLRGVVAEARVALLAALAACGTAAPSGAVDVAETAARLLARLGRERVREANPETWYGLADVSSDDPLAAPGHRVRVSPSRVEAVEQCALRWALEAAGGTGPDATAQGLGTLIHSIAQSLPNGSRAELLAELDRRWGELGLKPGWPATQTRRRAEEMIARLADYLGETVPVLIEAPFRVEVGRAILAGVVDRVEQVGDDAVLVADLKTGRTMPSRAEAAENPQLGAYQLAVEAGGLKLPPGTHSAGARLVYLAKGAGKPTTRAQGPLRSGPDGASWARDVVESVAETMAASAFAATENRLCATCPVKRSCPVRIEGKQVIA